MEKIGCRLGVMVVVTCVSACVTAEESHGTYATKLADGTTVELVGLRCCSALVPKDLKTDEWQWWRPDGTSLPQPPDTRTTKTSQSDSFLFAIHIRGPSDCSCMAVGPWDKDTNPEKARRKGPTFSEQDDLRLFSLRSAPGQTMVSVRLGIATGDWTVVQEWPFWKSASPDSAIFGSEAEVVLRCPEQDRADVVAEVTHGFSEEATRLVLCDTEGRQHLSTVWLGGQGGGLTRHVHRFANLSTADLKRIEFDKRPYDYWIKFRNVSLRPGQQTQPEVGVEEVHAGLVGNPLPRFNVARIDAAVANAQGKQVLVCFWDVGQRPSRNCMQRLAKELAALESKGVVVIPVHLSSPGDPPPGEWLEKNHIPLLTETLDDGRAEARQIWGARVLPWLVLTDDNHVVTAEGITVDELNPRLD